jgi:hypothetical protein
MKVLQVAVVAPMPWASLRTEKALKPRLRTEGFNIRLPSLSSGGGKARIESDI